MGADSGDVVLYQGQELPAGGGLVGDLADLAPDDRVVGHDELAAGFDGFIGHAFSDVQCHQDFFHGLFRVAQELPHIVPVHGPVFWRQVKQRLFDLTDSWHDATPLASPAVR